MSLLIYSVNFCLTLYVAISLLLETSAAELTFKPPLYLEKSLSLISSFLEIYPNCELLITISPISNGDDVDFVSTSLGKLSYFHAGLFHTKANAKVKFRRFDDIHKLSGNGSCTTVILLLQEFKESDPQDLFNLLTPSYTSISRKDEDFFFFISQNTPALDKFLLSPKFGNKIKFKLGLDNEVTVKTVDFYHSLKGPEIISFKPPLKIQDPFGLFPDYTQNFRGFPLKLAIPKAPFRFEIELREDGRYHPKRGTYKPWLDAAMEKFNFTYNCFFSSYEGGTGIQFPNGSWVGAVADIRDNVADVAFFIAHILNRHKVVDWSVPLSYEWIIFVSHKPRHFYSNWAILWPFSSVVWILFLISILSVAICVKLITGKLGELFQLSRAKELWTLPKSLEYIYTTFVEQDRTGPSSLPYTPIRILCVSWLLFALVTANAYRAKLVSVMAFPMSTFVPTTYEELVDSHFGVGMHMIGKGDAAYTIFEQGRGRVYEGIFARMVTNFNSPLQCLLKAVNEDFGCLMWEGLNDYLNVKNISRGVGHVPTQVSITKTSFVNDGLIYERRAIIRKTLDDSIRAARDTGLTKKWVSLDFALVRKARMEWEMSLLGPDQKYIEHTNDEDEGPKPLSFDNCASSVYILLAGLLMSLLQFLIERFYVVIQQWMLGQKGKEVVLVRIRF